MALSEQYKIKITYEVNTSAGREGKPILIEGWMPESITTTAGSEWGQPFDDSFVGGIINDISDLGGKLIPTFKALSSQVWQGNTPIAITIPIEFIAYSSALKQVVEPTVSLIRMALPREEQFGDFSYRGKQITDGITVLKAPGPSAVVDLPGIGQYFKSEDITVKLGSFMTFKRAIIKDVNVTWDLKLSPEGYPMRSEVEIQIESPTVITKQGIDNIFNLTETSNELKVGN